ncbi:hypothetical protein N7470_003907 [Penicillium chermesinum]|nr:hypothetical protein N7470_003907 [Penicillium chermesinum]
MSKIYVIIFHSAGYGDTCPWGIYLDCPQAIPVLYQIFKGPVTGKYGLRTPFAPVLRLADIKISVPVGTLSPAKGPQQFTAFIQTQPIRNGQQWNDQSWVLDCLEALNQSQFVSCSPLPCGEGPWYEKWVRKRAKPIKSKCFKVERTRTQAKMTGLIFRVQLLYIVLSVLSAISIAGIFTGSFEIGGGSQVRSSWTDRMTVAVAGVCFRPLTCPL